MGRWAGFGGEKGTALRYFRADIPAKGLRAHGWTVDVEPLVINEPDDGRFKPWDGRARPWPGYPQVMVLRTTNDLSLAVNDHPGLVDDVIAAQTRGQRVVLDLDDDLWNIPIWSPAFRNTIQGGEDRHPNVDIGMLDKLAATVDALSVSTPRIAEVAAGRAPGANIHLLRNGIDVTDFHPHEPVGGRALRVGWMGGAQFHGPHLRQVIPALETLAEHHAEFIHMGWVPETKADADLLHAEIRDAAPGVVIGWTDWLDYPKLRQALAHIDIGIIPRVPSEFNEGQSTSSGMAYAAAGIPFLVAPSAEYRRLATWGAGIVCDTLDDWRAGLEMLLTNTSYREARIADGYSAVSRYCGLRQVGNDWHDFLDGLLHG